VFEVLRILLVLFTGRGYDRPSWLNHLHHKLSYRLHKLLPFFGIKGKVTLPLPFNKRITVLAEDGGVGHQFIMYRRYEPYESGIVEKLLEPGMIVYNIGANVGYYTILCSLFVEGRGKIYAFEPSPKNFALLKENVEQNRLRNVELFPFALADREGSASLGISTTNSGDHQLFSSDTTRDTVEVQLMTVDSLIAHGLPKPNLILMDVQGAEAAIVEGMEKLLAEDSDLAIIMEFWPGGISTSGFSSEEMLQRLTAEGKREILLIDERKKRLSPISVEKLLETTPPGQERNLLIYRAKNAQ